MTPEDDDESLRSNGNEMRRDPTASWEIIGTAEFTAWFNGLTSKEKIKITAAADYLADTGPAAGRPIVDSIKSSEYPNMKELRPRSTNIRILFAFDPEQKAIFLIGGDKTNQWEKWYKDNIPIADVLFAEHIKKRKEAKP